MGEKRNVYRLLVGKPEGKRPLGRPRRGWIDNIKMDLLEIGLSVVDWIGEDNKCLMAEPLNFAFFFTSQETASRGNNVALHSC
jgi:hypothetical protein